MNNKIVFTSLLWKFGERISAQLVTFIISIVIARILSPSDYGAIAIIMVFITLADVLVCNGFASALIQKKEADDIDFSSVFYFTLGFSIALYFLLFFTAPAISDWYKIPILCPTLRVLGIRIIIGAINSVQQSYVSRRMEFKKFFYSTLGGTLLSGVIGIIMAYSGFGIWTLVAQYLINTTIGTLVLWFTAKWRPVLHFSWNRLKGLLSYGWKLLASAMLGALYDDLRTLIIGKVYSTADLAFYSRGQQFPALIMNNVNTTIASVFFPVLSAMQDNPNDLAQYNRKLMQMLVGVLAPLMLGLAAVSTPLVKLLLTDKWLLCVPFVQICCIYYLISAIYIAYLQSFKAVGRSGLSLAMEIIDDVLGITLVIAFFKHSVMAIAVVTVISRGVACLVTIIMNRKLFNVEIIDQVKDIFAPISISVIMYITVYFVGKVSGNYIVLLIIQIGIGAIVYTLLSILFRTPIAVELIKIIKRKMARA